MALSDELVLPAVVVEVFQADTPAGTAGGECTEAGFKASIGERAIAIIVVEAVDFAGQLGNDDVGLAVGGERGAGFESAFGERSVAVVVEEKLLHAVVGDEDVREAVVVIVSEGHGQGAALLGRNAGLLADIFKRAISAIAI